MQYLSHVFHALTAAKNGPTIYDLCDPLLGGPGGGDAHLRKFYQTAIANPLLRPLLARAGLPRLRDPSQFGAVRDAIVAARDQQTPDWTAIGQPVAHLLDQFTQHHPARKPLAAPKAAVPMAEIDRIVHACARHLLGTFARHGFIPAYAAFNLTGDPDFRGREFLIALRGLNARTYKNSTLLFNLARAFIAGSQAASVLNPPWSGLAEQMWSPVQIRHRSAYYDAFYAEALMDFLASGLATPQESDAARRTLDRLIGFCLRESREQVPDLRDGMPFDVVTAIAPSPHARFSRFFANIKSDLGFEIYVPDCDTTACSLSAASQFGSQDPILDQPMIDFYASYQIGQGDNREMLTVPINDNIAFDGGIMTWIENLNGDRPYGNDLDPTLNLDVLELCFRNCARWKIVDTPQRLATVRRIVDFQRRLVETDAFADPRSHIYYLPELYCAYFGRCHAALRSLPAAAQEAIDPDRSFELIRRHVIAYVRDELLTAEINAFDAALALLALAKLGAEPAAFTPALSCIARSFGEGGRGRPFKAYEWNKMKTPTRIVVGGPEVTSAFVLSALVHARRAMNAAASSGSV
ncbi:MAG: hypothetical protein QOF91_387 [Alphaproteobacteria bacterium]|nr:hypothetical protein [Alphaproteobacteria bacterium]